MQYPVPIILPRDSFFTELVMLNFHQRIKHNVGLSKVVELFKTLFWKALRASYNGKSFKDAIFWDYCVKKGIKWKFNVEVDQALFN